MAGQRRLGHYHHIGGDTVYHVPAATLLLPLWFTREDSNSGR